MRTLHSGVRFVVVSKGEACSLGEVSGCRAEPQSFLSSSRFQHLRASPRLLLLILLHLDVHSHYSPTTMAPQAAPPNPLLDRLDITPHPRPFKNHSYKAPIRRNKNLKQILSDPTKVGISGASTPDPSRTDPARAAITSAPLNLSPAATTTNTMAATYSNIESAPSLKRGRKWCDITGLPANYTDPKTKLRYVDGEVYKAVRSLPAGGAEKYLEVRAANIVLK